MSVQCEFEKHVHLKCGVVYTKLFVYCLVLGGCISGFDTWAALQYHLQSRFSYKGMVQHLQLLNIAKLILKSADKFHCGKTQIQSILQTKEEILKAFEANSSSNTKRS